VFRAKGWTVAQTQREADGGADLVLTRRGERGLVECKQWRQEVDVLRVRAFYGVMAAEKVRAGYFVTTSFFTPEAERFANEVGIHLIAGSALLRELATVRGDTPSNGENETPRCPLCGSTMRLATGRFGPFWGCSRFPDECKGWLRLGQTEPTDLAMVPVSGGGPP
jgi:restriction system protein